VRTWVYGCTDDDGIVGGLKTVKYFRILVDGRMIYIYRVE
jgi:hypothetical protein